MTARRKFTSDRREEELARISLRVSNRIVAQIAEVACVLNMTFDEAFAMILSHKRHKHEQHQRLGGAAAAKPKAAPRGQRKGVKKGSSR